MEKTVFQKIIDHELPAEVLFEDERIIAILDRFPTVRGQSLLITKTVSPYVFALPDDEYMYLLKEAKRLARALDRAYGTLRTCLVIEGFDVPHVHVRLYPMTTPGLRITHGDMASDEELAVEGETIRAALAAQ